MATRKGKPAAPITYPTIEAAVGHTPLVALQRIGAEAKAARDAAQHEHARALEASQQSARAQFAGETARVQSLERERDAAIDNLRTVESRLAAITGLGNFDVQLNGKDLSVEVRFHSFWAKRDGKVQFISWQATRTPPK